MGKIVFGTLFFLFSALAYCQESNVQIDSSGITGYNPPLIGSENIFFNSSGWRPVSGFSLIDISAFSKPDKFYQLNILMYSHTFFNIGLFTMFPNEGPFKLNFWAPVGLRLPLLCGSSYNFFAGTNFYIFPSVIETEPDKGWTPPKFIDTQLRLEYNLLGFSVFTGYRKQISDWTEKDNRDGRLLYKNDITGVYFGVSVGLKFASSENEVYDAWIKVKQSNNENDYTCFINEYPETPYTAEAKQRLEYLFSAEALRGNFHYCNKYLNMFPNGKYYSAIKEIKDRIYNTEEENAFNLALKGSIRACDAYLEKFPEGKNYLKVTELRKSYSELLMEKNEDDAYKNYFHESNLYKRYQLALSYAKAFPKGKHIDEVNKWLLENEYLWKEN